jgi:hypothetical protein
MIKIHVNRQAPPGHSVGQGLRARVRVGLLFSSRRGAGGWRIFERASVRGRGRREREWGAADAEGKAATAQHPSHQRPGAVLHRVGAT